MLAIFQNVTHFTVLAILQNLQFPPRSKNCFQSWKGLYCPRFFRNSDTIEKQGD